jgi:DNA-binding MarR family transcriptional regulator
MKLLTERHADKIRGVLSCLDRIVITGTIPHICHADGMSGFLRNEGIRIFDFPQWAKKLRDEIRANAEKIAQKNGIEIEFMRKSTFRKEDRVKEVLGRRGTHPGLVHILSAMESCSTYQPWHDKKTHKTFLKPDSGKCLHYYFYFILPELGLCYLRVPTWAPFRLQFYCNGHNILAYQLDRHAIPFKMVDNAFSEIEDWDKAQSLSDSFSPKQLHRHLDRIAKELCPIIAHFQERYHWSIMQLEYATDIVFRRQSDLAPLYQDLVRTAIHSVKPENVATFLGRRLTGQYQDEIGNDFHTRIEGTRIKHHMGKVAIKMYDKYALILRIETTVNDVSFFKHHREVEHRNGTTEMKVAPVKKTIYSIPPLIGIMAAANWRYLQFISAIEDPTFSLRQLDKISRPAADSQRSYRGFNLFHGDDLLLFQTINRGEINIRGFKNRDLQIRLNHMTSQKISRHIKRLRKHGLIKKVAKTYRYYLTSLGRKVTLAALKLREMFIIPCLRGDLTI